VKKFLCVVLLSGVALSSWADSARPHHVVSVGTDGLGLSGLGAVFNWDKDDSGVKDHEGSEGNLRLNYHYIFSNGVMLGGEFKNSQETQDFKYTSGEKYSSKESSSSLALSVGYNFNDDFYNAWWVRGALGAGSIKSETKDTTETPQKTTSEYSTTFVRLEIGKRFSFDGIGLKNVTYSPSVALTSFKYGKDAKDDGLKSSLAVQINLLKFDLVF